MAGLEPRVEYLESFRCPLGGLAAGPPRVLCHGAALFVSAGSERVSVYEQEGRLLTAVYSFPAQVWHLELSAVPRLLYVLCAQKGIYCLSPDPESRFVNQDDGGDQDSEDGEPPCAVISVDPDACLLPDATLCTFTVVGDKLVTLAQGPAHWKVQLFECPRPGEDARPRGQVGEVELSTSSPLTGPLGEPTAARFLPVLCCVSPAGLSALHSRAQGSGAFLLERTLFGQLFGVDASLLESPVILCGLPDGQLCCVVLKTLVTSKLSPGDPKALVKILHHLEEPVVFIGAVKTESLAEDVGDTHPDCLVALGHDGRVLAIKAGWDEAGTLVPELREYRLPGPVLCAACGGGGRVYHSTTSELCVVDLAQGGVPSGDLGDPPSLLCAAGLGVCSVVTLSVLSEVPEGGVRLLALSTRGRLMTCRLPLSSEVPGPTRAAAASTGQKIKDLLSGIGTVSERVSSLRKTVDQRNKALTCLNEAMNVSCILLSSREGPRPISCTVTTAWSHPQLQDVLMATCRLENSSGLSLDRGWALCVRVLTSASASDSDVASVATTYTIPVDRLGPGDRREVTLPLGPGEDGILHLPLTVSCTLHYSLREVVGGALAPSESSKGPSLDECRPDVLPEQDGICLPLSQHTVDMLWCLRFPGLAAPHTQAPGLLGPLCDPVDTFLGSLLGPRSEPTGPASLRAKFLPPLVATIHVSAELLRAALGNCLSAGTSLGCAALQWLLAENAALDVVRARRLSSVQGVAPDGADVHLTVREVAVTDLGAAGPVQTVEIQVESSSLASMCSAHHAVIGRLQRMVVEQAARIPGPPDLRVQCLQQTHSSHETLLREVQTLRDRLCTEDEASPHATAQRLLQVYGQLRSPSLLLV
ncbi:Fanconi anemia core complex-associated protein 100 isoform X3 [Enhydra lutris kenyoni]|uniref:Fanconi anemia core complex-associated protein 100 isoform X3 n=1 Tax=Enhydra lutris kenyoni TaxID=391180 RepID=A0A2Y9L1G3_ENHLU|nr:Fanconi anemia core complex-associated protein 100 isoform X3 [Enhydra lutris kenyoni]